VRRGLEERVPLSPAPPLGDDDLVAALEDLADQLLRLRVADDRPWWNGKDDVRTGMAGLVRALAVIAALRFLSLRHLTSRPSRYGLTALGVACGVALYVAIALVNRATLDSFRETVDSLSGKAQLSVFGPDTGFSEDLAEELRDVEGVKSAVAMTESRAFFTAADGSSRSLVILGIDMLQEAAVRSYRSSGADVIDDPLVFLNNPDSLVVTRGFAHDNHLEIGSKLPLITAFGRQDFVVRGLLEPEGPARAYGGSLALMDIDGARYSFGKQGKADRIDLVARKGADLGALARRLEQKLGPAFRIEPPDAQAESLTKMVESYQALLGFFSLLALLVGVFLVANAVSVSVAERRREIGTLRALGATRATIVLSFLAEALLVGAIGAGLGIALGRGLAGLLVGSIARSMSVQYLTPIAVAGVRLTGAQAAIGLGAGILASLVAALLPALRTTRIHPLEALRPPAIGEGKARSRTSRLSRPLGAAMLVALLVSSRLGLAGSLSAFRVLDPIFAVGGALLAGPWLVVALVRLVRRAFLRSGSGSTRTVMRLACDNLLRDPRRTDSNVRSLLVGLMLVVVLATMGASFRSSISGWFARTLQWDLLVSAAGNLLSAQVQPLHERVGRELAAVPGVEPRADGTVTAMRFVRVPYGGRQVGLKAFDRPASPREFAVFDVKGRPSEEAGRELFDSPEPAAMVSESFALNFGKREGDRLELEAPAGKASFRIIARVTDFASPEGVVYLTRAAYERLWNDPLVTTFGIQVAPGHEVEEVRREIDARFGRSRGFITVSGAEMRAEAERSLDEAFAITWAIEAAALLVALFGLLNTLLISVMERFRELGMLRAIGMSRRQLAGMILAESALVGVLGAIVAAALGAFVSWAWLVGSLSQMIGWVIEFRFPWASALSALAAGAVVALLAGWLPSRRAASLEIREALDHE
jgi:putative ABC transport system permease protein